MPFAKISKEDRDKFLSVLKDYLREEMECEAGELQTEFLLDFFLKTAGGLIYNAALADARYAIETRLENVVDDTLIGLEKPARLDEV